MNSNSGGGYDISSLTRHRPNPQLLAHHPAFGHQQHQGHHHGQHPLLLPNLGVIPPNSTVMHHPSASGHHLTSHFNHQVLHQPMHHQMPTASPAAPLLHQSPSNHLHLQTSHLMHPNPMHHHQESPVVPPPAPSPAPSSVIPVVTEATNTLACSVNLGSIQALLDVLVELPLPSEAPEIGLKKSKLIPDDQQNLLSCLSMDQHNIMSQVLSSSLQTAKMQVNQMNPNFKETSSSSSSSYSSLHQKNAYLLSLLNHVNVFTSNATLPPSSVTTGPQTRHQQQQQQYWNPWTENNNQTNGNSHPSPAQTVTQVQSPYHQPSYPVRQSASQNHAGVLSNNSVMDTNSNSSSSFTDPSTPTPLMTPSSLVTEHRYPGQQAIPSHSVQPQQQPVQQQQQLIQRDMQPVVEVNHFESMEPVIMLDKNDPTMDRALQEYYAKANGPESSSLPSLADRIKSNKRQRLDSQSKSNHERKEKKSKDKDRTSSSTSNSSPVKKQSKMSSPSKSSSYTNSYISSGYLTCSAPQLKCISSSLPAGEKFDAMVEELFELGSGDISAKNKKASSGEDTDTEDNEYSNKNKSGMTNGDGPALFDITLSGETLSHFVAVTAKLKRNNQMQTMSTSKVSTLLTALTQQLTVQSVGLKKRRTSQDQDQQQGGSEDDDEENDITSSTSLLYKFESCCDCSLIALNILSSKGMSSRVYLEECIEQVIAFLNNTIQQFTTIGAASSSCSPSKSKSKSPKKVNHYNAPAANKKILSKMYTKWSELIGLLVELLTLRSGSLTDVLVLSTTRLALAAFFLENLSSNSSISSFSSASNSNEIQLNALRLTTVIFAQYPSHRVVILDELLSSIARLPTSKRGRVVYKVDGDEGSACISMFSALLQELIQSLFLPKTKNDDVDDSKDKKVKDLSNILKQQYEAALKIAFTFMSTFLRRCCGIAVGGQPINSSDGDLRVLFECLVSDLMVTLHKPNWPAAQLLTQVLVKILITNITSNTKVKGAGGAGPASSQLNLKLASLDHLGTICSRFAKELSDVEGVKTEVKNSLNTILTGDVVSRKKTSNGNQDSDATDVEEDQPEVKRKKRLTRRPKGFLDFLQSDEKLIKEIWKHLIRFCDEERLKENKNLLVSIWLREMEREMEQLQQIQNREENSSGLDANGVAALTNHEQLEAKVRSFMTLYLTASNANLEEDEYHVIDSKTAELIIRYLDISQSTTVKLFDSALGHVIAALSSTSNTTMRSKAMKSLSVILNHAKRENATALLARTDLQRAMKASLCDPSTSVREATIDLIGKFILSGQTDDLIDRYYDIIAERVLDTGVSVRKRVIKILRDICLTYPSYKKVPEVCSKIIKRVNDDGEGIRKLVTETFTAMWFKEERDREAVRIKVKCINHVVATVLTDRIGTEWLQQLLSNLFAAQNDVNKKKTIVELEEDDDRPGHSAQQLQQVVSASSQIVDVIVSEILCGDDNDSTAQRRHVILSAITTLWLFAKVSPQLLLNHISTLHPFLASKCTTQMDIMILSKVVQILEFVLPKVSDLSDSLLARIEEDLTKNIMLGNASVLGACVSCLATVINKHSHNRKLAQDLFRKFFDVLRGLAKSSDLFNQSNARPKLLRALFTCGLFAKHFVFLEQKQQLFEVLVLFVHEFQAPEGARDARDTDILSKALMGLGFMFERNPEYTTREDTRDIYRSMLSCTDKSVAYEELVQCQILKNLTNYLSDEFNQELANRVNWSKENLKSMCSDDGDSNSLQSTIIQCYLTDVTKCTLSPILNVRRAAVNLVHIIHNGGHVHPLQLVPYLIAMSSDDDVNIRLRADHVLNEIERKYHGFVSMKSKIGVHLSYQLHSHTGRRGYRIENVNLAAPSSGSTTTTTEEKLVTGRLATLYSVLASNRQSRRAFVTGLLKYFDCVSGHLNSGFNDVMTGTNVGSDILDADPSLIQQFVCDNIVWLPYSVWDEPLYILTQIEINTSILASNVQSQFKDSLYLTEDDEEALEIKANEAKKKALEDGREGNPDEGQEQRPVSDQLFTSGLKSLIPKPLPSPQAIIDLIRVLKAYYMLIWCKHLLRELFGISDLKVQDYSPNEAQKVWDKPVHRKTFDVRNIDKLMDYPHISIDVEKYDDGIRQQLLLEYQRFKDVQVTGDQMSRYVAMILKEPFGRGPAKDFSQIRDVPLPPPEVAVPNMSREVEEELIQRIRANECSVSLENVDLKDLMSGQVQQQGQPSLKMTISIPNNVPSKNKKKKKDRKKKKKKHRKRAESDEEEDDSYSESDEESDEDPDYS